MFSGQRFAILAMVGACWGVRGGCRRWFTSCVIYIVFYGKWKYKLFRNLTRYTPVMNIFPWKWSVIVSDCSLACSSAWTPRVTGWATWTGKAPHPAPSTPPWRQGRAKMDFKGGPYKGCFHLPRALLLCEQILAPSHWHHKLWDTKEMTKQQKLRIWKENKCWIQAGSS